LASSRHRSNLRKGYLKAEQTSRLIDPVFNSRPGDFGRERREFAGGLRPDGFRLGISPDRPSGNQIGAADPAGPARQNASRLHRIASNLLPSIA